MITKILSLGLLFAITMMILATNDAHAQTPTTITIDISGTVNPADEPYGITCVDSTNCFMTLFKQGAIVPINKVTKEVGTIIDNDAVVAGQDWYSIATDPNTGTLYINEADTGKMRIYDGSFTTIAIPQDISGGQVIYTTSYNDAPNRITITGSGNTYDFGFNARGEIKFTNGFVWQLIDYNYDFNAVDNGAGVADVEFHGIARVDPSDNSVTRYAIAGATQLRGLAVDSTDATILWMTDIANDKLYRFDTDTLTVTDTVDLPVGTAPRGLATDTTAIYVAMNQVGGIGENSKILKVLRTVFTTSEIDTGAENTSEGTFAVYVENGFLFWSDGSGHVGNINIATLETSVINTVSINSNRFGALVGSEFWFAGHGSAKITAFSFGGSDTSGGSGDSEYRVAPTFGKIVGTDIQVVDNGITYNDFSKTVNDNFHTDFPELETQVGVENILKTKVLAQRGLMEFEVRFGVPEKGSGLAESIIEVWLNNDGSVNQIQVIQEENIVDANSVLALTRDVKCQESSTSENCKELTLFHKFLQAPQQKIFAIGAIDLNSRQTITTLNEGVNVVGDSKNTAPTINALDRNGKIHNLVWTDPSFKDRTVAVDEREITWNLVNGLWIEESKSITKKTDAQQNVMTRKHSDFASIVDYTQQNAKNVFDSSTIQNDVKPSFAHKYQQNDKRTQFLLDHDLMWVRGIN